MNEEVKQEYEINLLDLVKIVLRKWWVVGLVTAAFMVVIGGYAYTRLDDKFTASSSMVIQQIGTGDSEYQTFTLGQKLVDTYHEIATSSTVLEQLIAENDLDYSVKELQNMITMTSNNDTVIVSIEVESYSAADSALIANEIIDVIRQTTLQYDGLETVQQLDVAKVPTDPSGPNRLLYVLIGIVLGGGVGAVGVLMAEFLDKKLKRPSDMETVLGLRLLGSVPYYDMEDID